MKYIFSLFFVLCSVVLLCNGECTDGVYDYGVSKSEQKYIVNEHNRLRKLLANGEVPGQPRAINLKRFTWDDYLAGQAQNIANTCIYQHQRVDDRRFQVGQNLARHRNSAYVKGANWTFATSTWWDEHSLYHYPDGFSKPTGHYTQMAWDDTHYVGCGYTHYPINVGPFKYEKLYVCNYGPAGNFPRAPYETGTSGCENLC